MKLYRMICTASAFAALISGSVTCGLCVAWRKASVCAWAYSTDCANCGLTIAPHPSPGYVQLCWVSIGCEKVSSTVMSCTDCGSCGPGRTSETATVPAAPGTGLLSTCKTKCPVDGAHHPDPGLRSTVADARPDAANVLEYQHGQKPMLLFTLCVKVKVKFSVPSAGLEIPSMLCSTHGPTATSVVEPELIDCQGQPNLMLGRWTLSPTRCRNPESAAMTSQARALRKIKPATTATTPHVTQRGMRRLRLRHLHRQSGRPKSSSSGSSASGVRLRAISKRTMRPSYRGESGGIRPPPGSRGSRPPARPRTAS